MRALRTIVATAVMALAPLLEGRAFADGTVAKPASNPAAAYDASIRAARERIVALRAVGATLESAASEPAPAKLTPAQALELKRYDAWLHAASARVLTIATSWEQKVDQLRAGCEKDALCKKAASAKALAEMNMSFNAGYLNLQEQMHRESLAYDSISRLLGTKHDTVKNSISNVR